MHKLSRSEGRNQGEDVLLEVAVIAVNERKWFALSNEFELLGIKFDSIANKVVRPYVLDRGDYNCGIEVAVANPDYVITDIDREFPNFIRGHKAAIAAIDHIIATLS